MVINKWKQPIVVHVCVSTLVIQNLPLVLVQTVCNFHLKSQYLLLVFPTQAGSYIFYTNLLANCPATFMAQVYDGRHSHSNVAFRL